MGVNWIGQTVDVAGVEYEIIDRAPKSGEWHAVRDNLVTGQQVFAVIAQRGGRWKWISATAEQPKPRTGVQEKSDGMTLALLPADLVEWKVGFIDAVNALAETGDIFTAEDAVERAGLPHSESKSNSNNAVGAMMNALARKGVITKTAERRQSQRPLSHARELVCWVGTPSKESNALSTSLANPDRITSTSWADVAADAYLGDIPEFDDRDEPDFDGYVG